MSDSEENINPIEGETYSIDFDDTCLTVQAGFGQNSSDKDSPKVHLSWNMLRWLGRQGIKKLEDHYQIL